MSPFPFSRLAALLVALGVMAALGTVSPAQARSGAFSCVGAGRSISCAGFVGPGTFPQIVRVGPPGSDEEAAASVENDRKWRKYCDPIVRQDRYGVRRYFYTAPGCDVGHQGD